MNDWLTISLPFLITIFVINLMALAYVLHEYRRPR